MAKLRSYSITAITLNFNAISFAPVASVSAVLSEFSANLHLALSNILDRTQNPIICPSDSTPKVKSSKVEK